MRYPAALLVFAASATACKPDLGAPQSLVAEPVILAVRGTPAEAAPFDTASFDVLVATPDGTLSQPPATWALCKSAKPPSEPGPVSEACLADGVVPLGGPSASVQGLVPFDACQLFGPEVPPQQSGEPPGRPRDPDTTGGYYQPVRVRVPVGARELEAFGFERITCALASAGTDVALAYKAQYTRNNAPTLSRAWVVADGGDAVDLAPALDGAVPDGAPHVARGAVVTLGVEWPADSVESFPVYDLVARALTTQRESLRVSWYTSGGDFAHDRTGRGADDPETSTTNTLTVPATPGAVHLWVVLRDSRGGISWLATALVVD